VILIRPELQFKLLGGVLERIPFSLNIFQLELHEIIRHFGLVSHDVVQFGVLQLPEGPSHRGIA
jgi:hypothetical protein